MIKIENVEVVGWEAAIRGMRNPLESWDKSDSERCVALYSGRCSRDNTSAAYECHGGYNDFFCVGINDMELMLRLAKSGSSHSKYRRMIVVYADITAPLYWWKEMDTYKVGTVANSCSTMHTIHKKPLSHGDFSTERLSLGGLDVLMGIVKVLNEAREEYIRTGDKNCWHWMIQLLPASFNQRRTIMLNYETLANIYCTRKGHKLDEWNAFCSWIEHLPYSQIITLKE